MFGPFLLVLLSLVSSHILRVLLRTYKFRIITMFAWCVKHFIIKSLPFHLLERPSLIYVLGVISLTFSFSDDFISCSFLKHDFSGYTILRCQLFQHFNDIFYNLYSTILFLVTVMDKEVMQHPSLLLTYTHRHPPDLNVLHQKWPG